MTFQEEKGKQISVTGGIGCRIVVHEKTDPLLVLWLNEAIARAEESRSAKG